MLELLVIITLLMHSPMVPRTCSLTTCLWLGFSFWVCFFIVLWVCFFIVFISFLFLFFFFKKEILMFFTSKVKLKYIHPWAFKLLCEGWKCPQFYPVITYYSLSSIKTFLSKIVFRVLLNIFWYKKLNTPNLGRI